MLLSWFEKMNLKCSEQPLLFTLKVTADLSEILPNFCRKTRRLPAHRTPFYRDTASKLVRVRHARDHTPMKNLLKNIPKDLPTELFETLVQTDNIHIQRIVSKGHTSPQEGWYDQQQNEWVLVLKGATRLEFEDGSEVSMGAGDCLEIAAHVKHRVVWTEPAVETVWLGIFY